MAKSKSRMAGLLNKAGRKTTGSSKKTTPTVTLSDDMTSDEANAVGEALIEALGDRFSNVVKVDPVIIEENLEEVATAIRSI